MTLPKGDQGVPGLLKWSGTRVSGLQGWVGRAWLPWTAWRGRALENFPVGLWAPLLLPTLLLHAQCEVWVAEEQSKLGGTGDSPPSRYWVCSPSTGLRWAEPGEPQGCGPSFLGSSQSHWWLGKRRDGEGGAGAHSPGLILSLPSFFPVTPEKVFRESQTLCLRVRPVARVARTRRPTSLPTSGVGAAKTPTTSDPLACLTSTELPLSLLRRQGCESPSAGTLS